MKPESAFGKARDYWPTTELAMLGNDFGTARIPDEPADVPTWQREDGHRWVTHVPPAEDIPQRPTAQTLLDRKAEVAFSVQSVLDSAERVVWDYQKSRAARLEDRPYHTALRIVGTPSECRAKAERTVAFNTAPEPGPPDPPASAAPVRSYEERREKIRENYRQQAHYYANRKS
jgi:hypothetical protein